ncbi:bactofilin family protein [Clostridium ganghwense]|uniref:Polymer-forming cytoskeletal protein n=1 Tax=Clostridium ganghwense TaxID=312089 RepID=A0ABT4CNV9_9CLOT|nr:polymer-forming cytoskeletal protein [Clostridium ganghwense]MCY6369659.1 polymer-forming cytoskeletal protein [Clostridium ganghwense]
MFNENTSNKIENLIGEHCKIIGTLTGNGVLKLDGVIEGDIIWQDDVILAPSSSCNGNISCKNAIINGKVEGNVICENTLTIDSLGKITGNITMDSLIISKGGIFNGNCNMLLKNSNDI